MDLQIGAGREVEVIKPEAMIFHRAFSAWRKDSLEKYNCIVNECVSSTYCAKRNTDRDAVL